MLALLLASLIAAPAPAQAPTTLDRLAREAAPIALVRVERIHEVALEYADEADGQESSQPLRIAEVVVEQGLLGAEPGERSFLCLRRWAPDGETFELDAGDRALVFLDPLRGFHFRRTVSQAVTDRLLGLAGPRSVPIPLVDGVWRVSERDGRSVVEVPPDAGALPEELASAVSERALSLERLVAWLDAELDRVTPSIGASYLTNGPFPWSIEVDADGSFHGTDAGRLDARALAALWSVLEQERFGELPDQVGRNVYVDQSWFRVWTRRRDGMHSVRVFVVSPDELDTPAAREELARALRVVDALPGEKHPRRRK